MEWVLGWQWVAISGDNARQMHAKKDCYFGGCCRFSWLVAMIILRNQ